MPEVEPECWTTGLSAEQFSVGKIIARYADQDTHDQLHSEFKTDLDQERIPARKFDTNHVACQLAALVINILRLTGQRGKLEPDMAVA